MRFRSISLAARTQIEITEGDRVAGQVGDEVARESLGRPLVAVLLGATKG